MSGQELKDQLDKEVKDFKSAGDSLGFACSAHKHIVYPGGTDAVEFFKWLMKPSCRCGAKATEILVQRIHRDYIGSTLYETVWTKNKEGEWIKEKGNKWPEYSKKTYFALATD